MSGEASKPRKRSRQPATHPWVHPPDATEAQLRRFSSAEDPRGVVCTVRHPSGGVSRSRFPVSECEAIANSQPPGLYKFQWFTADRRLRGTSGFFEPPAGATPPPEESRATRGDDPREVVNYIRAEVRADLEERDRRYQEEREYERAKHEERLTEQRERWQRDQEEQRERWKREKEEMEARAQARLEELESLHKAELEVAGLLEAGGAQAPEAAPVWKQTAQDIFSALADAAIKGVGAAFEKAKKRAAEEKANGDNDADE